VTVPRFVVMAIKDRHEMTAALLRQLTDADQFFLFDNGSRVPFPGAASRPTATIHQMWNEGLDAASAAAGGAAHDVAVLNNDLDVGPGFLTGLSRGLRSDDRNWLAFPDWQGLCATDGEVRAISGREGNHLSGWAMLLRGEAGLRFDERFEWWYGDDDLQRQIETAGQRLVAVGGLRCVHLESGWSTSASPVLQAKAEADQVRFEKKWDNRS